MSVNPSSSTIVALVVLASGLAAAATTDSVPASGGEIRITPIVHGSLMLEHAGTVVHVDPWSRGDYSKAPKADLILITDVHGDHLDAEAIAAVRKESTVLVAPDAAAGKLEGETVIANGEVKEIAGIEIEAVPMYNLERGPEEGQLFHTPGRGNGYILDLGGKRIYIAGDTECIPEMEALEEIEVAFVPMNLPYTMPPSEAAACVAAFAPRFVYPYHYRGSDLDEFSAALAERPEIEIRVRDWYPER